MPKNVYHYHPITGEYLGFGEAKPSPLDFKAGIESYLVPKHATLEAPPSEMPNYVRTWDGGKWVQKRVYKVPRSISKDINPEKLATELKSAFPSTEIEVEGNLAAKGAKSITFKNLPDTSENLAALDAVIAAHVAIDTSMATLANPSLACFQVMCEEMRKINASFPDFATFSQKVNARMANS